MLTVRTARPTTPVHRPVLFIHGYFATAAVFDEWLAFFAARGFPAYAVNLRGRAESRPGIDLGRASIADFVDDVAAVARSIGTPSIVGHSMGGLIAQKAAERGIPHAVALICPAPPRGISVLSPRLMVLQAKYLWPIMRLRTIHPTPEDLRELVLNHVPPAQQKALLDQFIPDSGRAARDMSVVGVPVDAKRVRCPMLVIASGDDRFIPERIVRRVATRYGAPVATMAGHGHMLPCEPGWEAVADNVATFLADA